MPSSSSSPFGSSGLAGRIGHGYEKAETRHLRRDFVNAAATIVLTKQRIEVRVPLRAHNQLLLAAGFDQMDVLISWLGGKHLHMTCG